MKLYSLLILTKNTTNAKKNLKHHVNKTGQQYTLYTTYSHVLDGVIESSGSSTKKILSFFLAIYH